MKTLNDSLREEYQNALKENVMLEKINLNNLDLDLLKKAFDILLNYKSDSNQSDKARGELENYLINQIKSKC